MAHQHQVETKHDSDKVVDIICDAGGAITGRTRLQKLVYFLEIAGLGEGFFFEYRHYGPYSEELTRATWEATVLGLLTEKEYPTSWGGFYSVFEATSPRKNAAPPARIELVQIASSANPIELELAATAAYLSTQGVGAPWEETQLRKSHKADDGRLENAKELYRRLQQIKTPYQLPSIA